MDRMKKFRDRSPMNIFPILPWEGPRPRGPHFAERIPACGPRGRGPSQAGIEVVNEYDECGMMNSSPDCSLIYSSFIISVNMEHASD